MNNHYLDLGLDSQDLEFWRNHPKETCGQETGWRRSKLRPDQIELGQTYGRTRLNIVGEKQDGIDSDDKAFAEESWRCQCGAIRCRGSRALSPGEQHSHSQGERRTNGPEDARPRATLCIPKQSDPWKTDRNWESSASRESRTSKQRTTSHSDGRQILATFHESSDMWTRISSSRTRWSSFFCQTWRCHPGTPIRGWRCWQEH